MIGKNKVQDLTDGLDGVNSLTLKSMRTRMKAFVIAGIGGQDFDREKTLKIGSFLSKQFWEANIKWGNSDNLIDNVVKTARLLRNELPAVQLLNTVKASKKGKRSPPSLSAAILAQRFKRKPKADKVTMTTSSPLINCDDELTTCVV